MDTVTFTLPAHWAPALINGDNSGNSEQDDREIELWIANNTDLGEALDCSDYAEFQPFHDATSIGVLPCDCFEFTFPVIKSET